MKIQDYFNTYVLEDKEHLVGDADFEKYYKMALSNERVKMLFLFNVLVEPKLLVKFLEKTKRDRNASKMYENLYRSLRLARLSKSKNLASYLLNNHFKTEDFVLLNDNNPDVLGMVKYLDTLVTHYKLSKQPQNAAVNKRLQEVDFANLV